MPDQKTPGGSGPYLTKDAFYVEMKEVRDRQDTNKREILNELRRVADNWKDDNDQSIGKIEARVLVLETTNRSVKMVAGGFSALAGVIGAALTAAFTYFTGGN